MLSTSYSTSSQIVYSTKMSLQTVIDAECNIWAFTEVRLALLGSQRWLSDNNSGIILLQKVCTTRLCHQCVTIAPAAVSSPGSTRLTAVHHLLHGCNLAVSFLSFMTLHLRRCNIVDHADTMCDQMERVQAASFPCPHTQVNICKQAYMHTGLVSRNLGTYALAACSARICSIMWQ